VDAAGDARQHFSGADEALVFPHSHKAPGCGTFEMMKTITVAVVLLAAVLPLCASSYYPSCPDDAEAVYLTREQFSFRGDGVADDTDSIQQAINRVQERRGQGIVFVPSGRYRLTKTIYIWPGIRVIGYGSTRPTFVLGPNTPGFQKGPAYMVFFAGGRPGYTHKFHQRPTSHDANVPEDASPLLGAQ
jgi:pectate lyase-like protein